MNSDKNFKGKQHADISNARIYNNNRIGDKWEHFRESKLEKMRAHKASVERRMRSGDNLDNRMYWSQRNDKLKRYARHESLDPSWYTDNIYSNQSIDFDEEDEDAEDDYSVDNEKFERYFERNAAEYGAYGADDNATFDRKRGHLPHADGILNYPKSRSCCFGGGYNKRPKPQLMPKSSSFSVTTSTRGDGVTDLRSTRIGRNSEITMDIHGNSAIDNNNIGYRKLYCWPNGDRDYDKYGEVKEIYHIDRDKDIYKQSKNDIIMEQQAGNANCIRNIWRRRVQCKNNNFPEVNGNYQEEYDKYRMDYAFDACHFVEEYLIVPEPMKGRLSEPHIGAHIDYFANAKRHNSLDHKLLNDPIDDLNEDNSNLLFEDLPTKPRTKNMLEVKPPNRFDDTSSDSTDLDLDDFNFDFEKYWSELDYRNNNVNANSHLSHGNIKGKNVNVDKFNNRHNRDININDLINEDSDSTANFASDFKQNIFDLLPSPTHTARPIRFSANSANSNYRNYNEDSNYRRPQMNSSVIGDLNKLSPIEDEPITLYPDAVKRTPINNNDKANRRKTVNGSRKKNHNNSARSLINNIFSIYKPKKYSPVNCRPRTKADVITKGMNVASTVRPLGTPYNDLITSDKRPLTITPPRPNGMRQFSATVDQPYFKIIPEKTGLKISPLYRFGYEDDSKLRLKCTARPLLFPL